MGFLRGVFRLSNLGTLVFFALNLALVVALLWDYGDSFWMAMAAYLALTVAMVSPVGEALLAYSAGGRKVKRIDDKLKIIPLLEAAQEKVSSLSSKPPRRLRLLLSPDPAANAYAVGRHTVVVTQGLLALPDGIVVAVLCHELGHLAHRDGEVQLMFGASNLFITAFLALVRIAAWIASAIFGVSAAVARSGIGVAIAALLAAVSTGLIYLWSRFCLLFSRWSQRKNEFTADDYARRAGMGAELAAFIDSAREEPTTGLLKALYDTHPSPDARVARLQANGVLYNRWQG